MSTFTGTYGSASMLAAVAEHVALIEASDQYDVHTVLLVLNGQHGEFDLRVEATDSDMQDYAWEGIAHRTGGVSGWHRVTEKDADSLRVSIAH